MFVLNESRVVEWPVDVSVPVDGGRVEVQRFTARFVLLPDSEVRALAEADADGKALLRRVLAGAEGVSVEGGTVLDFGELRERLLEVTAVRRDATRAYFRCLHGIAEKNAVTPPPGGPAAAATSETAANGSGRT